MYFKTRPTHPIEILKWEHEVFLKRLQGMENSPEKMEQIVNVLKDLEEHQEAEERFVFPLVSDHQDDLSNLLRKQHAAILNSSDVLLALVNDGLNDEVVSFLKNFKNELIIHFETERTGILDRAMTNLNEAQIDVLRIKFATRRIHFL
ncbi:MAG: hemerythrin domain-containing protein [Candidatus Kryptoniota bacterium]